MILLMKFERPTTCRYYMPQVVVHVVADVVLVRVLMSAFAGCRHGALHALGGNGPQAASHTTKISGTPSYVRAANR
jgi:hypothetical protein